MGTIAVGQHSQSALPGSLAGQGPALLCWAAVVALGYAAWRRRRGTDASDLLVVGGLWLAVRLGLLVAGLPGSGQPGDDWLAAALDLAGLLLLAWPFLAPPLPVRWANRLVGIGLVAVALACGVSLWQWVRGTLGLCPTLQFTITWAHGALALAGLASLNLLRVRTRRRDWLLTAAGALLVSISGLLIPLPVAPPLSSVLTAATATFAAAWLNWLERVRRKAPSATPGDEMPPGLNATSHLLEASVSLFAATDLAQALKTAAAALTHILEIRRAALLLAEDEPATNGKTPHLRLVARWPQADSRGLPSPLPPACRPILANALTQGPAVSAVRETDRRRLKPLGSILGAELEAALILPLSLPSRQGGRGERQGLLVLGYDGALLDAHQLQLCRMLSDQVAIVINTLRLRAEIGQQARALAHLVHRQEQETGRLRAILEGMADGIVVSDADDQVVLTNSAALDILGVARSDILGSPFGQIAGGMVPAGDVGIIGTLTEGSPYGTEEVFEVSDRVVQTSMAPVKNGEGAQLGMVTVLRDITALARAEAERERLLADLQEHTQKLEQAAEQLRELDRLKLQFIANVSHELRTPLNSIIGFSGVMLKEIDGTLTDTQREDVEAIYTSGKHLLGMITDILDISQMWAGKVDLTMSAVDVREMVEDAVTIATPLIGDKPLELVQALDPDLPAIWADKTRTRQVLLNLLTNAIKYTERGQVTVSASRDADCVTISVADTGIGIPPEHLETVFEAFGRVDNSRTRKAGGLGLGLSISRHLVELQGGRIWVESEVGVGSTFHFSLPIEGSPAIPAGQKLTHQQLEAALARWQGRSQG
jgi:PAS domain S-box-containing protein